MLTRPSAHDRLPPLPLLRSFEAAARHLSFKQAAAELHVTPAAISQQIKALELHLGVPLFVRLTRALQLSEAGARLLPGVREGLASLARAVQRVQPAGATQVLTVSAPPAFASHWLLPRLPDFAAQHPEVEIRQARQQDAVDKAGAAASLARLAAAPGDDGLVLAIVYGLGQYAAHPGHRVDELLTPEHVPVCAPGLAAAEPPLRHPADLCDQVLIHDDTLVGDDGRPWGWPQWLRVAGVQAAPHRPGRRFSNAVLAIAAARAGQGVALAARTMVAPHLADGSLVVPFDRPLRSPYRYCLVARDTVAGQPVVVAFRHWLQAQAGLPAPAPSALPAPTPAHSPVPAPDLPTPATASAHTLTPP